MTIHDDRNSKPADLNGRTQWGMGHYIFGGIAALALIFGLMFMLGDRNAPNVANRTDRPLVTTTGSGAASSTIPNNPNGTTPQRDINRPTTSPSPAR